MDQAVFVRKILSKSIWVLPNSQSELMSVFFLIQMAVPENACQDQDHKLLRAGKLDVPG